MEQYVTAVLAFAAISFLCSLLFPSESVKTKKAFTFALALLFLTVLLRPLSSISEFSFSLEELKTGDLSDIIEDAEGETMQEIAKAVAAGIEADLESRFSLPRGAIVAAPVLAVEEKELRITSLTITLFSPSADGIAIRDYARKNYTPNCEVKTNAK
jgi:hypothetical protein